MNDNFDLNIYDNLKTVELIRGRTGYGFDLKGDRPSIIGSVRKNSPADLVGLKEGDLVIAINNTKVTDLNHEKVVSLIGQSKTHLILQVTKFLPNNSSSTTSASSYNQPLSVKSLPQQIVKVNERNRFTNILNNSSINKSEYTEDDDFDDEDEVYMDYRKKNLYDDEESIESSEDDCSMQPFYAYKLKTQAHNIRASQRRPKAILPQQAITIDQTKKRLKNSTLDCAFLNNENFEPSLKIKKSINNNKKLAQKNQFKSPIKPTLSQSSGSLPSTSDLETSQKILNVNDLYAILSPLIKPFVYNKNIRVSCESSICVNCTYLRTIHIPYDTISNALKLNSIRQSIEYFVTNNSNATTRTSVKQEKQVLLSLCRDKLIIKEVNDPKGEIMFFTSKQIGFCGTIKQHQDHFALITLSNEPNRITTSSSNCILFRLLPSDDFVLEDVLNLISRIYRYENYVFNTQAHTTSTSNNGLNTKTSTSSIVQQKDKKLIYNEYNEFLSHNKDNNGLNGSSSNLRSASTYSLNEPIIATQDLPKSCTTDAIADFVSSTKQMSQSNTSINKQQQPKLFTRNTENTQSIKIIKENLTNLFLSKFNSQSSSASSSSQMPTNSTTEIKSKSELKSSQTFKSKLRKSTFQFLKSKPPTVNTLNENKTQNHVFSNQTNENFFAFLNETEQQQQQIKHDTNFKINSRLSLQQSSNNMLMSQRNNQIKSQFGLTNQQRRLSDYHRPSKVRYIFA